MIVLESKYKVIDISETIIFDSKRDLLSWINEDLTTRVNYNFIEIFIPKEESI